MRKVKTVKENFASLGRKAGYSSAGRKVARHVLDLPEQSAVRSKLRDIGAEGKLRLMATEALTEGKFYAKISIKNWKRHVGKNFRLLENGTTIYENRLTAPAKGLTLEYRNIAVSSTDKSKFSLNIDAPFTMSIGPGAFYTAQQDTYDKNYSIRRHGKLYYATRGNHTDPERIIFAFPGSSNSTSNTPYTISYLNGLKDSELKSTLLICFQDRYGSNGTYLQFDNSGHDLSEAVTDEIEKIRRRFNIEEKNLLFYGASKGGSIAIRFSKPYPKSRLVISCPQLHIRYYLKSTSFMDGLGQSPLMRDKVQPLHLLAEFIDQKRRIDYLYASKDEVGNYSFAEQLDLHEGLNLYCVDGSVLEVNKKSLPTILNLLRNFLRPNIPNNVELEQKIEYQVDSGVQVQVRISAPEQANASSNWYLVKSDESSLRAQLMTQGKQPFVKYTNETQKIVGPVESAADYNEVVGYQSDGTVWIARNDTSIISDQHKDENNVRSLSKNNSSALYEGSQAKLVQLTNHDQFGTFRVDINTVMVHPSSMVFHLIDSVSGSKGIQDPPGQASTTDTIVKVTVLDSPALLPVLIRRITIDSGCDSVQIENHSSLIDDLAVSEIRKSLVELNINA